MSIHDVRAIDVHAHYGTYPSAQNSCDPFKADCWSGDAEEVARRARAANVEITVVSPMLGLMPRGRADAAAGNEEAARVVPRTPGLRQWVIVDPANERTFDQAREMLAAPHCLGIKIHPEEHVYHITRFGDRIFSFAAELRAVVMTHSGELNSLPDDFLPFADAHPEMSLILAHIGCAHDGELTRQVRAVQKAKRGNVYADTSSACSMYPRLIEFAAREAGAERVLFGTDTPCYSTALQRARIDSADLSDAQKKLILRDNALRLLKLPAESSSVSARDAVSRRT